MKISFGPVGRLMATVLLIMILAFAAWAVETVLYPGITVDEFGKVRVHGKVIPNVSRKDVTRAISADPKAFADMMNNVESKGFDLREADTSDVEAKLEADKGRVKPIPLPGITITKAETTDLMSGSRSCINYSWVPTKNVCCKWCKSFSGLYCCLFGDRFDIKYWEVSEVIEVSCRTGYSMLNVGKVPTRGGGETALQSCQGFNKPGNSRWFFEARVWTINGDKGGLRHQGAGDVNGARMRQCTMLKDPGDLPWPGYKSNIKHGYGKKWDDFSRGAQTGPSGSWEAYISDSDPEWAKNAGAGSPPDQQACQIGSVDMEKCWGPVSQNGWVNHPNPKVAAALVAWRAHQKAASAGKVSPPGSGGGYRMAMEYPWLSYAGEHGKSMGFEDKGKKGSGCFTPGDSGPEWFGGKRPEEIPDLISNLNQGQVTTVSEVNPGVYIFTVWVYTSCTRFEVLFPTPLCHYMGHS